MPRAQNTRAIFRGGPMDGETRLMPGQPLGAECYTPDQDQWRRLMNGERIPEDQQVKRDVHRYGRTDEWTAEGAVVYAYLGPEPKAQPQENSDAA